MNDKTLGVVTATILLFVVLSSILSLFYKANFQEIFLDRFILNIIFFSFYQSAFSTLLSIFFAIPISLALYKRDFFAKSILLKIFSLTFVLPSLVAVFGIVYIYGNSGLLNTFFDTNFFNIYGLFGILLAHTFFNIPLATKVFYQALCMIDTNQHKIAAQLGLNAYEKFKVLEFPYIKQEILQIASLIFMLCFTSFAVVMALGGGPKSTTIEVAIYQAIKYDFDLNLAAVLSLLQIFICSCIAFFIQKFSKNIKNKSFFDKNHVFFVDSFLQKCFDIFFIFLSSLFILPPIFAIVYSGLNEKIFLLLKDLTFLNTIKNSLLIATCSAFLALIISICIILGSRAFKIHEHVYKAYFLELCGTIILLTPSLVISTGLFILLNSFINVFDHAFLLVVLVNSLIALPFVIRTLSHSFYTIEQEYSMLCKSLNLYGINRLFVVEFKALKNPLSSAISLSFVLSMGDLSAISLFGNWDFKTLPLLLFEQLGSYKMKEAAATSLVLLSFSLFVFFVVEFIVKKR